MRERIPHHPRETAKTRLPPRKFHRNHKKPTVSTVSTTLAEIKLQVARAELKAAKARAEARWHISALCRDLIPTAAKFARKGRPRLLAVVSKIIADDKLRAVK